MLSIKDLVPGTALKLSEVGRRTCLNWFRTHWKTEDPEFYFIAADSEFIIWFGKTPSDREALISLKDCVLAVQLTKEEKVLNKIKKLYSKNKFSKERDWA